MARPSKTSNDFESRYFDLLIDRLNKQDDDRKEDRKLLEAVHAQTQKTNGRVTKLEAEVFKQIVPWYTDTKLLYIAGACLLVFLLILAAVLRVEVPGL